MVLPSTSLRTVVAAVLASALCTSASLAALGENAKLTVAENKVSIGGQPKAAGSTLAAGETIVTGARSRAEVTLPDGTVVRIGQASSFSFDGTKLVLSRGSALFHLTRKNTTIATPALVRTGQPGVVSVHASPSYNALFVLEGTDTVNGTPLVAGTAWVREGGAPRTFAFDLKKMTSTSTLVTKFAVTPWIANTQALATLQQKLVAANNANPAQVQVVNRTAAGATNKTGANGITLANSPTIAAVSHSGATTGILGAVRSLFAGNGGTLAVNRSSNAAGTLTLTGNNTFSGSLTKNGAPLGGTLVDSNPAATGPGAIGGASGLAVGVNTATLVSNLGLSGSAINVTATNGGLIGLNAGTLQFNPTISGNLITSGNVTVATGTNLTFAPSSNPATLTLLPGSLSTGTINGVAVSTFQLGQNATLNGITYSVASSTAGAGGLVLTRITPGTSSVLGVRPPPPVPLLPKPRGL